MHISIPGNWASNSLVFAISHGSCAAAPSTPSQRSTLSRHAVVPSRFPVQVRRVTQRPPPSEPLLSARVIQRRVRRRNFAMCDGFPALGLLRRPPPHPDAIGRRCAYPRPDPPGWDSAWTGPRAVPTFTADPIDGVRRPAIPLRHRHGYAADLHRGLPTGEPTRPRSSPPIMTDGCAPQPSPYPPGLSWRSLKGRNEHWFLAYTFPSRLPDPHHLAVLGTSRRCRGCFPPSPASPGSGCPQLHPPAATARRWRSLTSTRTTAPRGARST